jgi:hypothetical protein
LVFIVVQVYLYEKGSGHSFIPKINRVLKIISDITTATLSKIVGSNYALKTITSFYPLSMFEDSENHYSDFSNFTRAYQDIVVDLSTVLEKACSSQGSNSSGESDSHDTGNEKTNDLLDIFRDKELEELAGKIIFSTSKCSSTVELNFLLIGNYLISLVAVSFCFAVSHVCLLMDDCVYMC